MITGKLYDYMKWTAQVLLPGVGTLYVALAALWSLPEPQAVAGTILAVDTFLGVILGISQTAYANAATTGQILLTETDNKKTFQLVFDNDNDLDKLYNETASEVRFKVVKPGG